MTLSTTTTTTTTTITTTTSYDERHASNGHNSYREKNGLSNLLHFNLSDTQRSPFPSILKSLTRMKMVLICILQFGQTFNFLLMKVHIKPMKSISEVFCGLIMLNAKKAYSPIWKSKGTKISLPSFHYRLIVAHPSFVESPDRKSSEGMISMM